MAVIDPESAVPVYKQVARALRERIDRGELQPGRVLPSEQHLQQEFGAARDTIRRAIRHLTELGLVHTVPGRGTFVRAGTTTVTGEPGMRVFARPATDAERARFDLSEGCAYMLVAEKAGGEAEAWPADAAEVRISE
ncbi:GntR family transcriptional regulator [Microtetraspora malaysiensis]|uniref:GntR family transcriptional regulator n=1 Tax=Microtetraspora malaysiensis TaxID=161358 RepID=UPI003D8FBBED